MGKIRRNSRHYRNFLHQNWISHSMKFLAIALLALSSLSGFAASQDTAAKIEPTEHTFVLHNFRTESGLVLPEAKIVYASCDHLNSGADNAILLPSHYMAEMHGYSWLIGTGSDSGKALDP